MYFGLYVGQLVGLFTQINEFLSSVIVPTLFLYVLRDISKQRTNRSRLRKRFSMLLT